MPTTRQRSPNWWQYHTAHVTVIHPFQHSQDPQAVLTPQAPSDQVDTSDKPAVTYPNRTGHLAKRTSPSHPGFTIPYNPSIKDGNVLKLRKHSLVNMPLVSCSKTQSNNCLHKCRGASCQIFFVICFWMSSPCIEYMISSFFINYLTMYWLSMPSSTCLHEYYTF